MKTLRTITVGQLKDLLDDYDENLPVIFAADYGDYHHTEQALPLKGESEELLIEPSAYSNSGFAIADNDDDEDNTELFLVIR